jgi:regulator of protease activity HflC (stomatin/prohibitin superfamily)
VLPEYKRGVVFRLGRFRAVRGPGLYWLIPGVEWQRSIDIRVETVALEGQETVTKDSVTIGVNAVLWFRVLDPEASVIKVADYRDAVYQVALTSLRTIIGAHVLDEVLKERDAINTALREVVDSATDPWGVRVDLVEIKDVEIPTAMQRAMAREAEAVREKRARLIKADAEAEASDRLTVAAQRMAESPFALELRRLQMVSEVGAEHNTTTVLMIPSDFADAARAIANGSAPRS